MLDIQSNNNNKICSPWSERTILFQLFWGVAVMFSLFSLFYMFYLYLAIGRFQKELISGINEMISREGRDKFDIVMMATLSMVKDHFQLTQ